MFPTEDVKMDLVIEEMESQTATIGRSFFFDIEKKEFKITDGAVEEITSIEAVKQWLTLLIHTLPDKYMVYKNTKFGIPTDELIGHKNVPQGFINSELKREIEEACKLNSAIDRISDFTTVKEGSILTIKFTVHMADGTWEEVTVNA